MTRLAVTAAAAVIGAHLYLATWGVANAESDHVFVWLTIALPSMIGVLILAAVQRVRLITQRIDWLFLTACISLAAIVVSSLWILSQPYQPAQQALSTATHLVPYAALLYLGSRPSERPLGAASFYVQVLGGLTILLGILLGILAAADFSNDRVRIFFDRAITPAALGLVLIAAARGPEIRGVTFREGWALPLSAAIVLGSIAIGIWTIERLQIGDFRNLVLIMFLGETLYPALLALLLLVVCNRISRRIGLLAAAGLLVATLAYGLTLASRADSDLGDVWVFLSAITRPFALIALSLVTLEARRSRSLEALPTSPAPA